MARPTIEIDSFADLKHHEKEILERIAGMPNGGNLFLAHPFLLFKDIEVSVSKKAHEQLLKMRPALFHVSAQAYGVIKSSSKPQPTMVRIKHLFNNKKTHQ